jgi:hypothetical protein
MVAPINYGIQIPDPTQAFTSAFNLGAGIQEVEAKQQQAQRQLQMEQQVAAARQRVMSPDATAQDYLNLSMMLPENLSKPVREALALRTNEQNQRALRDAGQVFSALNANKPEIALSLIDSKLEAAKNSGNQEAVRFLTMNRQLIENSPEDAKLFFGSELAMLGGKEAIESVLKQREDVRKGELQAPAVRRAVAEADEAEGKVKELDIKLRTLEQVKAAELLKAQSDAERAQVEARFAERLRLLDIERGKAQAARDRATAAKTEAETLELKDRASKGEQPTYNAQAGGYIVPVSKANPNGGFIPLNQPADAKSQQAAVQALKTAGYDPVTGEDNISNLIKKSTGSTLGMLTDEGARLFGGTNAGMKAIAALEPIAKQMAIDMLGGKLGAGISNADRDFIVSAFGDISNPRKTREEKLLAWNSAKNRMLTSGMLPPPTQQTAPTPAPGQPVAPALSNLTDSELLRQLNIPAPGRR